jgi:hypothetical protein
MKGHYRKPINDLINELALLTHTQLCLRDFGKICEVYDVNTKKIIASGTTPQCLYSDLLIKRLKLEPTLPDPEPQDSVLEDFENL